MPVNNSKWVEDISEFNQGFIKSYADESDEGYFLEVNVQFPENHNIYPFFLKKYKLKMLKHLSQA